MKVLHLISSIDKGGAETQVMHLASMQAKKKNEVLVCFAKGSGYWKNKKKLNFFDLRKNKNKSNFFFNICNLIKLIKSYKPDIINVHLPYMEICLFFSLFFVKKNFKIICTKHLDNNLFDKLNYDFFLGNFFTKIVSLNYIKIIAISKAVKKFYLMKKIISNPNIIEVVYYGLDLKSKPKPLRENKIKEKYNIQKTTFLIGTVSRLVPQKSLHHLIHSFKIFNKEYNQNSKLIIVGKGYLKNDLYNYSKKLKVDKDIIWIDFIEDTVEFISQLNVFALSSKYEGLGLVLLEALFARTPIVASSVGAIPEIIKNNFNGKLVSYGNTKNFAKSMNDIKKGGYKKNCYKTLSLKFNDKVMFKKTMNIYMETLN